MSANVLKRTTGVPTLRVDKVETQSSAVVCAGAEYRFAADDVTGFSLQTSQGSFGAGILQLNRPQPGVSDSILQFINPSQRGVATLPAGGPDVAVANTAITANSIVLATLLGSDAVPIAVQTNPGVGFTITGAPTAAEDVAWFIVFL